MLNLISDNNLSQINNIALDIIALVKSKKIFLSSKYNDDLRIKASTTLLEITRSFNPEYRCSFINQNEDSDALKSLVNSLSSLLENKTKFLTHKLKDYSLDIKVKICRELVSDLEDLYILGQINRTDIDHVYNSLNKPVPKKFSVNDLQDDSVKIYSVLRTEIKEQAQEIKANSIQHYIDMTNRIDPESLFNTPKEFYKAGSSKISDFNTLRLCIAYKFDNDKFYELINNEFDTLLTVAANQISSHCHNNQSDDINVKEVTLGAKGFDILMNVGEQRIYARAIPVNGYFVRFHYRYIIT
jgi:hypothetical protein